MTEGVVHSEIVSVLFMDGVSFFMKELKVFLEGSDVLYGTFFSTSTVVHYGHSEIIHDSFFFFFFFKSIKTALIQIILIAFLNGSG